MRRSKVERMIQEALDLCNQNLAAERGKRENLAREVRILSDQIGMKTSDTWGVASSQSRGQARQIESLVHEVSFWSKEFTRHHHNSHLHPPLKTRDNLEEAQRSISERIGEFNEENGL